MRVKNGYVNRKPREIDPNLNARKYVGFQMFGRIEEYF